MNIVSRSSLAILAVLLLPGCAQLNVSSDHQAYSKGPRVTINAAKLGSDQKQACARVELTRVLPEDYIRIAQAIGILEDDFASIRGTTEHLRVTVTFRDSNPACAPHLRAGVMSKGHDVLTKTFTEESLPTDYKYLAGTVSKLAEKPGRGVVLNDPMSLRYLTPEGLPLTCDYDLMDMIELDGQRVSGESARDLEVRNALNAGLPQRGDPPHHLDRIMHGAQAEYPEYLRSMEAKGHHERLITQLMKPESPLTAIDHKGTTYRLMEIEDTFNFYRCHNVPLPAEWDVSLTGTTGQVQSSR